MHKINKNSGYGVIGSQGPIGARGLTGIQPGKVLTMTTSGPVWRPARSPISTTEINILEYSKRPRFEHDLMSELVFIFMSWIYFIVGRDYRHFQPNQHAYCYYKGTKLDRKDGPALIAREDNTKCWLKNGVIHREDGPAIIHKGAEYWYINGRKITDQNEIDEIKFKAFFSAKKNLFTEENNV